MGLPAFALAAAAGSAVIGAYGSIQAGNAAATAANYQAGVARNNRVIAQQNAEYSAAAGMGQSQRADAKTRAVGGAIEAAQGASGIDTGVGSPAEVRESAREIGRLDAETIMANAMQQSRAYGAQATNFGAQAQLDKMQGAQARTAGYIGAASSLVGGSSSFSDKWLRYQNVGVTF